MKSQQVNNFRYLQRHQSLSIAFPATGFPEPGKTTVYRDTATIDLDSVPLDGGVLFKTLYLSIDPFLRGRMRSPEVKSYAVGHAPGDSIQK